MKAASSSKLSALIIGVGSIGERHLRCFQSTNLFTVAACELNADLRKAVTAKYNCPGYSSLEEALSAENFDVGIVCVPANVHLPLATKCLQAGLHVLVEKPLAASLEGLDTFRQFVEQQTKTVRIAYVLRNAPMFIKLKQMIESGLIGEPKHYCMEAGQHFPTFRPAYREIYYTRHETGGGAIQDALTHHINAMEWLISPAQTIFAHAAHLALEGVEVEDTVNFSARLKNGVIAGILLNQFQAPNEITGTIHGLKGSIRCEYHNRRIGVYLHGDTAWKWQEFPAQERDQMFIDQALAFHSAIRGEKDDLCTLEAGIQTLKVNLATLESAKTHKEISI